MTDTEKQQFLSEAKDITFKSRSGQYIAPMTKADNVADFAHQAQQLCVLPFDCDNTFTGKV